MFLTGEKPKSDPRRKDVLAVAVRKTMDFNDSDQIIDIRDDMTFMNEYSLADSFTELKDRVRFRGWTKRPPHGKIFAPPTATSTTTRSSSCLISA